MTPSAYNNTFTAQAGTTGNTVVVNQASDPGAATGFGFAYGGYIPTSGSTGSITASPGSCVIAFYQRTSASTPGAGAGWTQFGSSISVGNSEVVEYQCGQAGGVVTPTIGTGTASNTDLAGVMTSATGAFSYSFAGTHTTAPVCIVQDQTTIASLLTVVVTTSGISGTTTGASDAVSYICVGLN